MLFSDTLTCCTFINRFVTTSVIPLYAHPDSHIGKLTAHQYAVCHDLWLGKSASPTQGPQPKMKLELHHGNFLRPNLSKCLTSMESKNF